MNRTVANLRVTKTILLAASAMAVGGYLGFLQR